jgi:soluble lytic murein transglycosylase-like protein
MKKSVLRWLPLVSAELAAQGIPLPDSLILSVINVESNGKPGIVNPKSGASGLMQVMPGTLTDYNQRHGKHYPLSSMRSSSNADARKQIEVGIAVLAHYWKRAYRYLQKRMGDVPVDELGHIADLFYAAGPDATMQRLDKLAVPTWAAVRDAFPNWNALPHPAKIFAVPHQWDLDALGTWLERPLSKIGKPADPKTGFALGVILLMATYWLMKKGKNK